MDPTLTGQRAGRASVAQGEQGGYADGDPAQRKSLLTTHAPARSRMLGEERLECANGMPYTATTMTHL